ncbi:MAG: YdcF family protein [Thermodesulfovibrionales bacterium]|nr:YdcF family protein [Thermodesulfovibrionales bacterium]
MKILLKLIKLIIALALLGVLLYFSHGFILNKAAEYLYYKDELKPADVIVILAGEETGQVEYGVKLFKEGWARKDRIIFSGGPAVWKYSWASLMKEHAVHLGVPSKAILLEDKSRNTEEKAGFTKEIMKRYGYTSFILVTSPYHSRRAFKIFGKIIGDEIKIISAPSEESWFRFKNWWEKKRERSVVLTEFFKFFWFWIYPVGTPNGSL